MTLFLPHERLDVYARSLVFAELSTLLSDTWPASSAVRDQLERATESLVTNLATAARLQRTAQGTYVLECSLGSVLECAACLDVALLRGLTDQPRLQAAKRLLQTLARMEVGLRNSWSPSVREQAVPDADSEGTFFAHESLAVYQRSLQLHQTIGPLLNRGDVVRRYARRIDELSTSLTLNIAEGNGRFSKLEHGKFADIAVDAGTKLAAYLDLAAARHPTETESAKTLLREALAMLMGLKGYLQDEG